MYFNKYIFSLYPEPICSFYFIINLFFKVGSTHNVGLELTPLDQGLHALLTKPGRNPLFAHLKKNKSIYILQHFLRRSLS